MQGARVSDMAVGKPEILVKEIDGKRDGAAGANW